jgi:hypothetical protein
MRAIVAAALAATLALAAPALAAPPKMPSSTKGTKRCSRDVRNRFGSHFRVYITKGVKRVSCRRADSIVRQGVSTSQAGATSTGPRAATGRGATSGTATTTGP